MSHFAGVEVNASKNRAAGRPLLRALIFSFLIFSLLMFTCPRQLRAAAASYEVPVKLMHAYEKDKESMGNPAMGQTAKITETPTGAEIEISFQALDFMNMHGHLIKLYSWDGEPGAEKDDTCRPAEVLEEDSDAGLDGQQMTFPSLVKIKRPVCREGEFYVRVRVDAMDSIAGGEGMGEQNARLVFDYSQAPAPAAGVPLVSDTASRQGSSEAGRQAGEQAGAGGVDYDLNKLQDGKYTVNIDLWHMHEDRPSMGNGSMNHQALLTVKEGKVQCEFTVHPMGVSGIVASLITFQYPDENGDLQFAKIVENELPGDKPSKFSFPLYKGDEYMHCMVDPNVDAMGNKPVDARFRFYWDSLNKVADDFVLTGDKETVYGDVFTPAVDLTDEATGIRLLAEERVLASGVQMKVETVTSGEIFDKAQNFAKKQDKSLTLYKISLEDETGNPLKPVRQINLQFPIPEGVQAENLQIINFAEDGTPNPMQGKKVDGKYDIVTGDAGFFAVAVPGRAGSIPVWFWICCGAAVLIVVIAVVIKAGRNKGKTAKTAAFLLALVTAFSLAAGLNASVWAAEAATSAANRAETTTETEAAKATEQAETKSGEQISADAKGSFVARIFGSYLNPDTGKTEDGGTQNAAIGEGMVDGVVTPSDPAGGIDSVFGKPKPGEEKYADALVEKRLDGKVFATVRLYLINFVNVNEKDGPFFKVLQPDGEYKLVDYHVTNTLFEGPDGVNYSDFRFEVPDPNFKVSVEMFVNPMGRAVKYFIVSTGELTAGAKDFNDFFVQDDNLYLQAQKRNKLLIGGGIAALLIVVLVLVAVRLKKNKKGVKVVGLLLALTFCYSLAGCGGSGPVYKDRALPGVGDKINIPSEYLEDDTDLEAVNQGKTSAEEGRERIVCTSVALCEMMDKLGINLVGRPTTKLNRMPARYDDIVQIGMPMNPNMEVIYSLKPTVVYCPDSLQDWLKEGFEKHQLPIEFVNLKSTAALYEAVESVGKRFGKEEAVAQLQAEYQGFLSGYQKATKDMEKPRVLLIMGLPGSYVVATPTSYAGSLLALSGAENIFPGDGKTEFMNVSPEEMLSQDPDIILRTAHAMPEVVNEMFAKEFKENTIWKNFRAVKEGHVYDLDSSYFGMSANFDYNKGLDQLKEIFADYQGAVQ